MKKFLSVTLVLFFIFNYSQTLKRQIQEITKGKNATVAVSVLDFDTNKSVNINGKKHLPMLSVFKFHIALTVLNLVDEGKLNLDQNIFIKKSELLENTWSPIRKLYPNGNIEMSLRELLRYTVAQSDNNGCDILLRLIGGTKTVQNFISKNDIKDFNIIYNEEKMHEGFQFHYGNWTSTNAANLVLKKFYEGKLLSRKSADFLLKTMIETTTGTNKIVAQLPKNIVVAHKTGSSGKDESGKTIAENDIAIVFLHDGRQYAISIFVSDSMESEEVNTKMIADISKITFNYFTGNR